MSSTKQEVPHCVILWIPSPFFRLRSRARYCSQYPRTVTVDY